MNSQYLFQDLKVGMTASSSYQFTEKKILEFSELTGDFAKVHTNKVHANIMGFENRIVHGLFLQSILSGLLGQRLPGENSVINSINLKIHRPVLIDQTVNYCLEITALTDSVKAVSLNFTGLINNQKVLSGNVLCSFPLSKYK